MIRRKHGQIKDTTHSAVEVVADGDGDGRISLFGGITKVLVARKGMGSMGYSKILAAVVAICGLLAISCSNAQPRRDRKRPPQADAGEGSKQSKGSSCVESLLGNENAILANSSLAEKSISFQILLHPPTKDKYITKKILREGRYEPEMEEFIARALPLNTSKTLQKQDAARVWAVDIGANIGFHSMHMARRGANTISFEPAPDTAELIKCTAAELLDGANSTSGSIKVVEAGASDVETEGKLSRHPDSPGMTTFLDGADAPFPLGELENSNNGTSTTSTGMIRLLRAEDVLGKHGVPEGRSDLLRLLKVDVEGFELRAFRGVNLTRFPFQFLTFEFFPKMIKLSGDDPVDILILVRDAGYRCDYENIVRGTARDKLSEWVRGIRRHVNIFCELDD